MTTSKNENSANAYRRWGYLQADLDNFNRLEKFNHPEIERHSDKAFKELYCGKTGYEFMHIHDEERVNWLTEKIEGKQTPVDKQFVFKRVLQAEVFEKFIHTRYIGAKRFSIEGIASLIPLLDSVLMKAAESGYESAIIGMSHRGRLTAMHLIAQVGAEKLFAYFEDVDPKESLGSGDVKYHKGATGIYTGPKGSSIEVRMASNPSHLEAINPVILGRVKGVQDRGGKCLAIILHGDAAFAGQGIAAETLNYAELEGFNIGGAVNIIVNNLIGFTAEPEALHSSKFSTSVAKRLPIPIFHVNAEHPDEVFKTGQLAFDYKEKFSSEVVIDLIGYRRFGHNEIDDPTATSPVLYSKVKGHPILSQEFGKAIGLSSEEIKVEEDKFIDGYKACQSAGKEMTKQPVLYEITDHWKPYVGGLYEPEFEVDTCISEEKVALLGEKLSSYPKDFNIHAKIGKLLETRAKMAKGEALIDWGMAEAMSFGSLLLDKYPVRLVGQDSGRGTFSHRQSVLRDIKNGKKFIPLNNIAKDQKQYEVYDSSLSEAAAVGFEYGYSRQFPDALICWEAQFGDFVNGAQIIIDQFISAGEDKWSLLSGLVMLLPHGYEGQGPEHSSARLERFLQLCGEDNMQVAQPSNAAQYFHLLRRQTLRKWRKPLIVMSPKSMLRAKPASSDVSEFTSGKFHTVLDDIERKSEAKKIIFCCGKIAHELRAERKRQKIEDVAVVTIEQLYPFPEKEVREIAKSYQHATQFVWAQDEPANMGALFFVRPILEKIFGFKNVTTVKRSQSASPATGSGKAHQMEQSALLKVAFASFR